MTAWVPRQGDAVNHQRVGRLRRQRGWEAIAPQPRRRQPAADQVISPDRVRGVRVDRVTPVWRADLTDIRLAAGGVSLVAGSAWFRREGLPWAVSSPLAVACGVEALEPALSQGQPEIVPTDPGAQFPRHDFTRRLPQGGRRVRLDGRGRALDHGCGARWWRSVKDAAVDRRDDQRVWDARQRVARSCGCDNGERRHQARGDRTPAAVSPGGYGGRSRVRGSAFTCGP